MKRSMLMFVMAMVLSFILAACGGAPTEGPSAMLETTSGDISVSPSTEPNDSFIQIFIFFGASDLRKISACIVRYFLSDFLSIPRMGKIGIATIIKDGQFPPIHSNLSSLLFFRNTETLNPRFDFVCFVCCEPLHNLCVRAKLFKNMKAVANIVTGAGAKWNDCLAGKIVVRKGCGNHSGGFIPPNRISHKHSIIICNIFHRYGDV